MPQRVIACIRGLGPSQIYVADGLERQEIWITKKHAGALPYQENVRVKIKLIIGDQSYTAGLRTTPEQDVVAICPNLRNSKNRKTTLARVLADNGFIKNQRVILEVDGNVVTVLVAPQD